MKKYFFMASYVKNIFSSRNTILPNVNKKNEKINKIDYET